tara:strand:+ start:5433 stop:5675 length:243 start_codon:yes stop_codon:yes gene_type:complete
MRVIKMTKAELILIANLKDKLSLLKEVARSGKIGKSSYALTAFCAKTALASKDYERMRRNLLEVCIQCGHNTDYDWELKF